MARPGSNDSHEEAQHEGMIVKSSKYVVLRRESMLMIQGSGVLCGYSLEERQGREADFWADSR